MSDNYLIDGPITSEVITSFMEMMATARDRGGHSFFLGQVRADEDNGKRVKEIEYSAYESMVRAEADKIETIVHSEFGDVKFIRIIHSVGVVKAGEISLAVLVSAVHRKQAIQACSRAVELIKEKLPVWKKEIFEDNSHAWRDNN